MAPGFVFALIAFIAAAFAFVLALFHVRLGPLDPAPGWRLGRHDRVGVPAYSLSPDGGRVLG